MGLVLGPHTRADRTRDTGVTERRLPTPEDGRPGEGQRLTPDAPDNGGRPPPPPGMAPHHPRGTQPPQGMQAKGTVLGPHTHTHAPTARGWRTPTARQVGGQSGEGERLTSDAPHNGGRHPPPGCPSVTPTASNAGPQGRTLWIRCWVPTPAPTAPGTHDRGTPAARPRGRAVGGGTAPDTRRPSQQWQARGRPRTTPTPRHAAPKGHAGRGDSVRPPHPHTRAHSTRVADPNSPPSGRAVGGGGAPDLRRPSQQEPQSRWGGTGTGPPGPKHARRSKRKGQDTRRGTDHVERPYQRPAPGPREVHTPHHPGGGGADAAGARAHTHAKGTRGLPEGQPDQARGTHRSRGMAYRRPRVGDTRTRRPVTRSAGHARRDGGNRRDTTTGTGPSPPNQPRAPRTHGRGTAPAKVVVAHCATPQPLG